MNDVTIVEHEGSAMEVRPVKMVDPNQQGLFPEENQYPEPIGTKILMQYKIVGYIRDAYGNLYAELMQTDVNGNDLALQYQGVQLDPQIQRVLIKE